MSHRFTCQHLCVVKVQLFCSHIHKARRRLILDDNVPWGRYIGSVEILKANLLGGFTKRASTEKKRREQAKRVEDFNRIKTLPPVVTIKKGNVCDGVVDCLCNGLLMSLSWIFRGRQQGVHEAMLSLRCIAEHYKDKPELPSAAQARANADLVGIVYCNGFAGRCMEWSTLPMAHFEHAVANNLDFVVCPKHKTMHHHGHLAKWLAPGTLAAMRCYSNLPRREGVTTFFHSVGARTAEVNIPGALLNFSKTYLPPPPEFTRPGVNLLRKWYHTHLMNLTKTEDALLDVMKRIDAHSNDVAKRHYVLRDPQQDAKLAQLLVFAVLGQTVQWPEHHPLDDAQVEAQSRLPDIVDGPDVEDDAEEIDLEYFPGADFFGIHEPLPALQDATSTSESVATAPLCFPSPHDPQDATTNNNGSASGKKRRVDKSMSATSVFVTHEEARAIPSKQLQIWDVAVATPAPPPAPAATEQVARTSRQLTMLDMARSASAAPAAPREPAPKKKAHHYTEAEIAWVLAEHEAKQGQNHIHGMAPKGWFEELFQKGIELNVLSSAGCDSGIRSLVKRHVDKIRAEEVREAALQKRREDHRLRKAKREGGAVNRES